MQGWHLLKKGGYSHSSLPRSFTSLGYVVISGYHSNCQKKRHFIFLFCFYTEELGRPPCTGTRGGITKACPKQKELCGDLPTVQRFATIPCLWSPTEYSEQLTRDTQEMSSPTAIGNPFLWWPRVKWVGLCHTLCSRQGYTALRGKRVPSGCLLCLVLYRSCGPSAVLSEVGLLGIGAERLRIHSDILSITHPVFKNADFSKEMSAGAGEWDCSKQARAFLFGEMGLSCLHSLHMTVLQSELNPVLLCRS